MEDTMDMTASRLGAQVRSGIEAVKEQLGNTAHTIRKEVVATAHVARNGAEAAVEAGIDKVRGAGESAIGQIKDHSRCAIDSARNGVQNHPERWLLAAVGAGLFAGACAHAYVTNRGARNGRA